MSMLRCLTALIAPLVIVLLAAACVGRAETITLSLPEAEASAKGKVDVVMKVEGAKNLVAMQFVVVHDPDVLKVDKVEPIGLLEETGALLETNFDKPGRLWIASAGVQPVGSDGELLKITYEVVGESGKKSTLTFDKQEAWQANEMQILVETKPGAVTVGSGGMGLGWLLYVLVGVVGVGGIAAVGIWIARLKAALAKAAVAQVPPPRA